MQEFHIGITCNPWLGQNSKNTLIQMPTDIVENTKEVDFTIKYKTEMCRNWENGKCEFGDSCAFAHGIHELREKTTLPNNYRTKKCKQFYELGYCLYGTRCQFKHREFSPSNLKINLNTQKLVFKKGNDDSAKRRLKIFEELEYKGQVQK
ncbi:unnamed protein product [Blepharisma stoltei]|uniref:C3H1-type domain-containing protein n=1 Tax=Blepharisma stoltei TaxID=1481888 RepID=A0AAU9IXD7_9CILI|nr:unnamed protein product [Blepharisma stoltei]